MPAQGRCLPHNQTPKSFDFLNYGRLGGTLDIPLQRDSMTYVVYSKMQAIGCGHARAARRRKEAPIEADRLAMQ